MERVCGQDTRALAAAAARRLKERRASEKKKKKRDPPPPPSLFPPHNTLTKRVRVECMCECCVVPRATPCCVALLFLPPFSLAWCVFFFSLCNHVSSPSLPLSRWIFFSVKKTRHSAHDFCLHAGGERKKGGVGSKSRGQKRGGKRGVTKKKSVFLKERNGGQGRGVVRHMINHRVDAKEGGVCEVEERVCANRGGG